MTTNTTTTNWTDAAVDAASEVLFGHKPVFFCQDANDVRTATLAALLAAERQQRKDKETRRQSKEAKRRLGGLFIAGSKGYRYLAWVRGGRIVIGERVADQGW